MKISLKEIIKEIERQNLMTEHKKAILNDIAIIVDVKNNGWLGYKIIGKNGFSFRYFYKKEAK